MTLYTIRLTTIDGEVDDSVQIEAESAEMALTEAKHLAAEKTGYEYEPREFHLAEIGELR